MSTFVSEDQRPRPLGELYGAVGRMALTTQEFISMAFKLIEEQRTEIDRLNNLLSLEREHKEYRNE